MTTGEGFIDIYSEHGVELQRNGTQMKGECPFCGHSAFYISLVDKQRNGKDIKKGFWDCFGCGESGNQYSFLTKILSGSDKSTSKKDIKILAAERGLAAATLQRNKVVKSSTTGAWLIPAKNREGGLSNVYTYHGKEVRSSTNCNHQLIGLDKLEDDGPIWLVEGHWDKMAWEETLMKLNIKGSVLGCPGANTFKTQWLKYLEGREANIILDNDEAGETGLERIIAMMETEDFNPPSSLRVARWPEGFPYNDVRDVLTTLKDYDMVYDIIHGVMSPVDIASKNPEFKTFSATPRHSFDELLEDYKQDLVMSFAFEHCLAVGLAVSTAVRMKGEPLWVHIVGPPSSGKSTICEALSCSRKYSFPLSKLRPGALDSGWQAAGKQDVSLIPKFNNKMVVIKDFTTVLSMPVTVQENVFGILRDCYDGVYRSKHGGYEGSGREYWSRFGMLTGVTYEIRSLNRSALGERFLQVEIADTKKKSGMEISRNVMAMGQMEREMFDVSGESDMMDKLRSCSLGFLDYLHDKFDSGKISRPNISDAQKLKIASMAEFCSIMRSQVNRDGKDKLIVRPTREQGVRLSKQLYKLAMNLCIVMGQQDVSERTMKMIQKTAMNTSSGFVTDIVRVLVEQGEQTAGLLSEKCQLNEPNIRAALNDMKDLGMVSSAKRGHKAMMWFITKEISELWENMKLSRVKTSPHNTEPLR